MTDKEKKVVFALIGIMVVILLIVILVRQVGGDDNTNTATMNETSTTNIATANEEQYVTQLDDGTKLNTSEDLRGVKTYNDLEISNIQVTSQDGRTVIIADVKNNASTDHEAEIVKLTFLGENDEILDVTYPVMPTIPAGGTEQLNSTTTVDAANFKDFIIEADDR